MFNSSKIDVEECKRTLLRVLEESESFGIRRLRFVQKNLPVVEQSLIKRSRPRRRRTPRTMLSAFSLLSSLHYIEDLRGCFRTSSRYDQQNPQHSRVQGVTPCV